MMSSKGRLISQFLTFIACLELCRGLRITTGQQKSLMSLNDLGLDVTDVTSLTFQVVACSDVHVALFDKNYGTNVVLYELVIGGWENTRSEVRLGEQPISALEHTPLDCCAFKAFWVSWDEGQLRAGFGFHVGEDPFFEILETYIKDVVKVAISTGWGSGGVWAMSFDGSHLREDDYNVTGYGNCTTHTVLYDIPLYPVPSTSLSDIMTSSYYVPMTSMQLYSASTELAYDSNSDIDCTDKKHCFPDLDSSIEPSSMSRVLSTSVMTQAPVFPTDGTSMTFGLDEHSSISYLSYPPTTSIRSDTGQGMSSLDITSASQLSPMTASTFDVTSVTTSTFDVTSVTASTLDVTSETVSTLDVSTYDVTTTGIYELKCTCPCWPLDGLNNLTLAQKIEKIRRTLLLVKSDLSAFRRRLTSADDVRPSSRFFGTSGAIILGLVTGLLVLSDAQRVLQLILDFKKGGHTTFELTRYNPDS